MSRSFEKINKYFRDNYDVKVDYSTMTITLKKKTMSKRNALLAQIHDLQGINPDSSLTKRDLVWILEGLRSLDRSNFTERDYKEYEQLVNYISHICYSRKL